MVVTQGFHGLGQQQKQYALDMDSKVTFLKKIFFVNKNIFFVFFLFLLVVNPGG